MIQTVEKGSFFDCGAEALVCTVNCVGVMGKGIALEFKKKFQDNFEAYKKWCASKEAKPGGILVFERFMGIPPLPKFIFNFATKDHWRDPSKIEWIASGLQELKEHIIVSKAKSCAVPALGCSNGGLAWDKVLPLIISALEPLDCRILLFPPGVY